MSTSNSRAGGSAQSGSPTEAINRAHLIAFICMVFGMFMAILDIQIVSASLSEIQAGLSASNDEIPWIQTAYLIAEVVAIPLSGFLSRALGTRILFAYSAAGFTIASVMCGLTSSMNEMIVWRALQGFIGGGMIPTVMAAAYTIFPRSKQSIISPMIGLIVTLAPTIGPTVGGYLTDIGSWHWLFFINVVPGIFVTTTALILIDFDKPDFPLFYKLDWIGLIAMAVFLGSAEYVLEEGPRYDWLNDSDILMFTVTSTVAGVLFFIRTLLVETPIVDLRAFTNRNFAVGCLFAFVVGTGLYGLTYIYPIYLARIRGYDALMVGETLFISGLAMFFMAPIAGRLSAKLDPRIMVISGFLAFALGAWQMTNVTDQYDFYELLWPQILRGAGIMMAMVPILNIALGTLPPERLKNAAGLYSVMRNLGGAIGLAVINTIIIHRTDFHYERLQEAVTWSHPAAMDRLASLTAHFANFGADAKQVALMVLEKTVHRQAVVMSFADVFLILAILFTCLPLLTVLLSRPARAGGH